MIAASQSLQHTDRKVILKVFYHVLEFGLDLEGCF